MVVVELPISFFNTLFGASTSNPCSFGLLCLLIKGGSRGVVFHSAIKQVLLTRFTSDGWIFKLLSKNLFNTSVGVHIRHHEMVAFLAGLLMITLRHVQT